MNPSQQLELNSDVSLTSTQALNYIQALTSSAVELGSVSSRGDGTFVVAYISGDAIDVAQIGDPFTSVVTHNEPTESEPEIPTTTDHPSFCPSSLPSITPTLGSPNTSNDKG